MERVKSVKLTPAAAPQPPVERARTTKPARPMPDPAERPKLTMDKYGPPQTAFLMCVDAKKGGGVPVHFREQPAPDGADKVRIYYAGAIMLGSVVVGPLLVSAHFSHNLGGAAYLRFNNVAELHEGLRKLLQASHA